MIFNVLNWISIDKNIEIGRDASGISNTGDKNIIIQIVAKSFEQSIANDAIENIATQIFKFIQEDKEELDSYNDDIELAKIKYL